MVQQLDVLVECVNALNRAILISTKNVGRTMITKHCVNALNRAILISTLPLWNRLI